MRTIAMVLALCSTAAFAQTAGTGQRLSRGNFVRTPVYESPGTALQNYFVDGTNGNDARTCTGSGTSACLTIQGAINKVPKLLRDQVTISVAAGSYNGFYLAGFTFDPGLQQNNGGILINGALVNSTLASGSATGTATSGAQGSGSTFGTLTKTAAGWTVNDLRGRFITITSGTGSGQLYPISSNTATIITIVGTWATAPGASSVYAIQDSSVLITGSIASPPAPLQAAFAGLYGFYFADNEVNYRDQAIVLQNINFQTIGLGAITDGSTVQLNQIQASVFFGIDTGSINPDVGHPAVYATKSVIDTGLSYFMSPSNAGTYLNASNVLFKNPAYVYIGAGNVLVNACEALGVDDIAFVAQYVGTRMSIQNTRVSCNGVVRAFLVNSGSINQAWPGAPTQTGSPTVITNVDIGTNCGIGVQMNGPQAVAAVDVLTGTALTTALDARLGGYIQYTASTTVTGTSQDINVEAGGVTAALGDVTSGKCLTSLSSVSRVCKR